jgi:cell wall-associated NlpC family hydrolase
MKLGVLMVVLGGVVTGCATGTPVGFRIAAGDYRYRPATPPSMPREVPSPDAERPPRVAAKPAPSSKKPAGVAKKKAPAVVKRGAPARRTPGGREAVLAAARGLMGKKQVVVDGRRFPSDCIGLVQAAYSRAGLTFQGAWKRGDNGVTAVYRYAQAHGRVYTGGRPVPGDVVFFRETYDQNRDGRRNDGLTHVGLVDAVDEDGTVTVIHRVQRGVVRYRMNLARKDLRRDPKTGAVLNDVLRPPGPGRRHVLTGQLFVAYATLLPPPAPTAVARR